MYEEDYEVRLLEDLQVYQDYTANIVHLGTC
jgi:hypothetical protein